MAKSKVNKEMLIEAVSKGGMVMDLSQEAADDAKELLAYRDIMTQAERRVEELKERIQARLVAAGAAAIGTSAGVLTGTLREREGIDKTKIPPEILEAAKTTTAYVVVEVKAQ